MCLSKMPDIPALGCQPSLAWFSFQVYTHSCLLLNYPNSIKSTRNQTGAHSNRPATTLSSVSSRGFGLVTRFNLPLIHTTRKYNNCQTKVRRILITLINDYNSLTNLRTLQIHSKLTPLNWNLTTVALYNLHTDHTQKNQLYCWLAPTVQKKFSRGSYCVISLARCPSLSNEL
jgi:hypothetical protein